MTRTTRHSTPTTRRSHAFGGIGRTLTAVLAAIALTSCASVTGGASQRDQPSPAPSTTNAPAETSWPSLEESGTGLALSVCFGPGVTARSGPTF